MSFSLWPSPVFVIELWLKYSALGLSCAFFIYQSVKLKHWHHSFTLNLHGDGKFIHANENQEFKLKQASLVTPLVILMRYQYKDKMNVLPIFRDMLCDQDYRHLSRLLLNVTTK